MIGLIVLDSCIALYLWVFYFLQYFIIRFWFINSIVSKETNYAFKWMIFIIFLDLFWSKNCKSLHSLWIIQKHWHILVNSFWPCKISGKYIFLFTMFSCNVIIRGLVMILQSLFKCPWPLQLSRCLTSSSVQPPLELKFNFAVNYAFWTFIDSIAPPLVFVCPGRSICPGKHNLGLSHQPPTHHIQWTLLRPKISLWQLWYSRHHTPGLLSLLSLLTCSKECHGKHFIMGQRTYWGWGWLVLVPGCALDIEYTRSPLLSKAVISIIQTC